MKHAEKFIQKSIIKHGYRYNYDKVNYINSQTKVIIVCPEHGDFDQIPASHSRGYGCPICGINKTHTKTRYTINDFIRKASFIHDEFYNYDKVQFINTTTKVTITCPIHGDFEQTPKNHYNGQGCPSCANLCRLSKNTSNTKEFIKRSKYVHGDYYNYDKVTYNNARCKVIITCPIHGDFKQKPIDHYSGCGCQKCGIMKYSLANTKDVLWFIRKSKQVHGNYYDYTKSKYNKCIEHVTITCPKHGDFEQKPYKHYGGNGCPKCIMSTGERKIMDILNHNNIEFIHEYAVDYANYKRLRFDFFIPSLNLLIEYDGEQHFYPINFNGIDDDSAIEIYKKTLLRDTIKNAYANDTDVTLLRIPYTEFDNIDKILLNFV